MDTVSIKGEKRTEGGKVATKNLRKLGKIPCVVYGGDTNVSFSTIKKEVKPLIFTSDFKLAEVSIDGEVHKCILKDVVFHPVTDEIVHMDFLKLTAGHSVKVEVPLQFVGASPGVMQGGKLIQQIRRIKIKATPENLVDKLTVDISTLELGDAVRVNEIFPVEGVEIINNGAIPVATVEVPRALKSAEAEEEEAAAAAAGAEETPAEATEE